MYFLRYFERAIACSLSLFEHEQYPSNSLDQNNSARGFYSELNEGNASF